MDWSKVIYSAVVLDEVSQEALKQYLNNMLDGIVPDKILCHHMTVAFGKDLNSDSIKNYIESEVGNEFKLIPVAYGESDKAIAIQVETNAITTNEIKHITLCTLNGGKPVDSNNITNWRKIKKDSRIQLNGVMTCITK